MTAMADIETLVTLEARAPSETGTFDAPDGLRLFEQSWLPQFAPRSVVVLVHGFLDHSGRYAHIASYLADEGHAVYTYDHRGHGRSQGRRGYVDTFDRYVADLHVFVRRVRRRNPDAPLFLLGHSMGGAVCAQYGLERGEGLAGLVLSSPMLDVGVEVPPLLRRFSGLVARLLPGLPTIHLDRDHLSRDPAVVAQAKADPLNVHRRIRARPGHEMVRAAASIRARMDALAVPLLVFHGTDDRITDARGSIALYARAASDDKTLRLYEGLYHETFNEPEKAQVLAELAAWLDEHLSVRGA